MSNFSEILGWNFSLFQVISQKILLILKINYSKLINNLKFDQLSYHQDLVICYWFQSYLYWLQVFSFKNNTCWRISGYF